MLKVTDYLRHADECETLVKTARTPNEVEALLQMAVMWRELAEDCNTARGAARADNRELPRFQRPKEPQSPSAK
jgi:hypothetical protein